MRFSILVLSIGLVLAAPVIVGNVPDVHGHDIRDASLNNLIVNAKRDTDDGGHDNKRDGGEQCEDCNVSDGGHDDKRDGGEQCEDCNVGDGGHDDK